MALLDKEILNMEEAAELFGVSVKTFIKLLKEEKVPARKIGREWRFSRKALIDWISAGDSQAYSSSEADVKEFFNKVAPEWEKISKDYYDETISSKLIQSGILKKGMTVLDMGAGDGYLSRAIAGHVNKVIAVDISAAMLKELTKKAKSSKINNIAVLEADGIDVPLEDSCIDVICSSMFLHHIEEPQNSIKEMYRLLKKGGSVFIADFTEHNDLEMKEKMHDIWCGFPDGVMEKWLEDTGFKNIKFEKIKKPDEQMDKPGIFILTAEK